MATLWSTGAGFQCWVGALLSIENYKIAFLFDGSDTDYVGSERSPAYQYRKFLIALLPHGLGTDYAGSGLGDSRANEIVQEVAMCGRYVIADLVGFSERFQVRQLHFDLPRTYNAAPSQLLPVIIENDAGEREVHLMQWGLIPRWQRGDRKAIAPINARAESLFEKPMFRPLLKNRRCLVPANGFYEWQQRTKGKQPFFIRVPGDSLFAFAGLYDEKTEQNGDLICSYTIVTTAANELLAPLHNRMPVILRRDDEAEWLSREIEDGHVVEHLLRSYSADEMATYTVGRAVNNVRNDGPTLIAAEQMLLDDDTPPQTRGLLL